LQIRANESCLLGVVQFDVIGVDGFNEGVKIVV